MKHAILMILAAGSLLAQAPTPAPRAVLLSWRTGNLVRPWLEIESTNADTWRTNGYDPNCLRIVTQYKPIVRWGSGQYEIVFAPKAEAVK